MKIQTQNRLAHYQVEYNECCEQGQLVQRQIQAQQIVVNQYMAYLQRNAGDKNARKQYNEACRELQKLNTQSRHIQTRLATLQRQINMEKMKIQRGR